VLRKKNLCCFQNSRFYSKITKTCFFVIICSIWWKNNVFARKAPSLHSKMTEKWYKNYKIDSAHIMRKYKMHLDVFYPLFCTFQNLFKRKKCLFAPIKNFFDNISNSNSLRRREKVANLKTKYWKKPDIKTV